MIDDIKVVELDDKYNLHMIKSKKFKTVIVGFYLKRPLSKKEVSKNALISRILDQGTREYPTQKDVNKRLEELYGSVFVLDVHKYGNKQMLQYKLQMPNEKFLRSGRLFEKGLDIFNEFINHPYEVDDMFDEEIVDREKRNLIAEINSKKDDKMMYSMTMCIEAMFKDDIYSIHEYGSVEEVEKIEAHTLLSHYKNILKTSEVDLCIIGDIDFDLTEKMVRENIVIPRDEIIEYKDHFYEIEKHDIIEVSEKHDVNQGKITLGYRTGSKYGSESYYPSVLFAYILGGGSASKLFVNLREKNSLCYYIFARTEKYKSLMLVSAGIKFEDYDEVIKLVEENIENIKNGEFTEEDIEMGKKSIIASLRSVSDYSNSFMNYYYGMYILEGKLDIEKTILEIESVTKEDILKMSKGVILDTISFIDREEEI